MYADRFETDGSLQNSRVNGKDNYKVQPIDRGIRLAPKSPQESLSAALRAADTEFGDTLHEVDEISRILKSDHPDKQILKVAAHAAVWSALD